MNDGGQWDMMVNLINKHGLVPKKNFPESVSSEASLQVNSILTSKVRIFISHTSVCIPLLCPIVFFFVFFFDTIQYRIIQLWPPVLLQVREYSIVLRKMVEDGNSDAEIKAKIDEQMVVVYRIVGICIGIPNTKFTWEYMDKSKEYHSVGPITPKEFYEKYVKPVYNVDDKVGMTGQYTSHKTWFNPSLPERRKFSSLFW